jgi:hypothetical protein
MTDLPELQHLLIEAAGRRSQRRRWERGARVVAVAVVAALAVIAVPRATTGDVEVPAITPTPSGAPATIADAYSVFRRPAGGADQVMLFGKVRGSDVRLVAKTAKTRVFLALKGDQACIVVRRSGPLPRGRTAGPRGSTAPGMRSKGRSATLRPPARSSSPTACTRSP